MTLLALLCTLVLSLPAHAVELESIDLEIQDFALENEKGLGSATRLDLVIAEDEKAQSQPTAYTIKTLRQEKNLRIALGPVAITWRNIPSWLQSNLRAQLREARITLSHNADHSVVAKSLVINDPAPEKIELEGLELACTKSHASRLQLKDIFSDCFAAGTLRAERLESQDLDALLRRVFPFLAGKLYLRNTTLVFADAGFALRTFTSVSGGVDVTARGAVSFDPATMILSLQLDQFHFGYIPMRGALLRVLRTFYADKVAFIRGSTIGIQL